MGIFNWFRRKDVELSDGDAVRELMECSEDMAVRMLSFDTCVNMVANAIGRCDFRTFANGKEVKGVEAYTWMVEPNPNENSTAFLHHLVRKLYTTGEALIVELSRRGKSYLYVADSFEAVKNTPPMQNEYKQVEINGSTLAKVFRESDVMHLKLHDKNVKPVIDALFSSYSDLISVSEAFYKKQHGNRYKVHVDQIAQGQQNFEENFKNKINNQLKPFFESTNAVLPEFDGYKYEDMNGSSVAAKGDSRDIKALFEDVFDFTARGFLIPSVLVNGKVEATKDANERFLTYVVDPICDQIQEEANRKRYGFDAWKSGNYLLVDSSSIIHYDVFAQASNVEKVIGSGVYSINDVLRAIGQPIIDEEWARKHYMTLNIGDAEAREL